jgi:hypothetical protein
VADDERSGQYLIDNSCTCLGYAALRRAFQKQSFATQLPLEISWHMSLSSEEERFVKELTRRAKTQNALPAYLIQTKAGKVSMSLEETKHLDPSCARESKT